MSQPTATIHGAMMPLPQPLCSSSGPRALPGHFYPCSLLLSYPAVPSPLLPSLWVSATSPAVASPGLPASLTTLI